MSTRRLCSRSMYASEASKSPEPRARAPAWCKVSPSRVCLLTGDPYPHGCRPQMRDGARGPRRSRAASCRTSRAAHADVRRVACRGRSDERSRVLVGHAVGAPAGARGWAARHGAVWVVGSGPGDVGPSSRGHDLSQGRFAAMPERKIVANCSLFSDFGPPRAMCVTLYAARLRGAERLERARDIILIFGFVTCFVPIETLRCWL